jgi:hypothetical protein
MNAVSRTRLDSRPGWLVGWLVGWLIDLSAGVREGMARTRMAAHSEWQRRWEWQWARVRARAGGRDGHCRGLCAAAAAAANREVRKSRAGRPHSLLIQGWVGFWEGRNESRRGRPRNGRRRRRRRRRREVAADQQSREKNKRWELQGEGNRDEMPDLARVQAGVVGWELGKRSSMA